MHGRENNANNKKNLLKSLKSGDDKDLTLFALCTTPSKGNTPSPATKVMKRESRKLLPRIKEPTYQNKTLSRHIENTKTLTPEH